MIGNKYSGATKHVVSIGGGFTSTVELPRYVLNKYGVENVDFFICALAGESADLWRLVNWLETETGKHVTHVAWTPYQNDIYHGVKRNYWIDAPRWAWSDIWDVFDAQGIIGNSRIDPCSRILKRETAKAYLLDHYDPANTTMHVGIAYDEIDRLLAIQRNWSKLGFTVEAPLADDDYLNSKPTSWHAMTTAQKCEYEVGFVPEVYQWGASHNNCGGFCVKAGHAHMKRFMLNDPERFAYHEQRETAFRKRTGLDATVMTDSKTYNGKTVKTPLTLAEFRQRHELQPSLFDGLDDTPACAFCDSLA